MNTVYEVTSGAIDREIHNDLPGKYNFAKALVCQDLVTYLFMT